MQFAGVNTQASMDGTEGRLRGSSGSLMSNTCTKTFQQRAVCALKEHCDSWVQLPFCFGNQQLEPSRGNKTSPSKELQDQTFPALSKKMNLQNDNFII